MALIRIPYPLVDTHCHLDHPSLACRLDSILIDAENAGVIKFIVPGVDPEHWGGIGEVTCGRSQTFAAYGVHPTFADKWSDSLGEKMTAILTDAVAVGEIGLDYHCLNQPRSVQVRAFRGQLHIAINMGLPVLIHCRGAFGDMLEIMKEEKVYRVGGIMHAFSGSTEIALEFIKLGFLISVAGPVTYENAVRPVKVVEKIPLSHLVLETDSPDMAPIPCRGLVNEPSFLPYIADAISRIKGIPYSEIAEITTSNSIRLFNI